MNGVAALIKSIVSIWGDSMSTPLYLLDAPAGTAYPLTTFRIVDSPRQFAMKDSPSGAIHEYSNVRVQFSTYGNADQLATCMSISAAIENLYKFTTAELEGGVTQIWSQPANAALTFFEAGEKIYNVTTDLLFRIGV